MRQQGFFRRVLISAMAGIGLALSFCSPAASLTPDEAEKVAMLLTELSADLGPFAYDDEEAGRIFDEDEAWKGRITAAGFDRDGWNDALGKTFRGYLATVPNDVFSARLTQAMANVEAMSHMTTEQKAEVLPLIEEKVSEIQLLRAEGAPYADMVRPHAAKIEAVFETGLAPSE